MATRVNVDNFAWAETDRMFVALSEQAGGINRLRHHRAPASVHEQPVVRQNRDTLYSAAIVDISRGATLTLPEAGDRYLSAMVVNNAHYINEVFHGAGAHRLTVDDFDTEYVLVAVRTLVDPIDPADLVAVHELQDQVQLDAVADRPLAIPDYDAESFDATRNALLALARGLSGFEGAFGKKGVVDPVRHLLGTAAGWGGLPEQEASYVNVDLGLPLGEYAITVRDVPVDGFWSISVYNSAGYFEVNDRDAYSINSVTATPDDDGSITVHFGGCADERANCLPIMDGWNYTVRLYRPRAEILTGEWTFPAATAI